MNIEVIVIIISCIALVIGAIMMIKKSAKSFKLTEKQLQKIKHREAEQQLKDKESK